MGKSGYTSLSLEEKRYAQLREKWNKIISNDTDDTFTMWATKILESAIDRTELLKSMYPKYIWIGKTESSIIIKDDEQIVEIKKMEKTLTCSIHKELCDHCIYAALHAKF